MVQLSCCHCHHIISWFIKIQNGLTFLVPDYPGCPGKEAVKQMSLWLLVQFLANVNYAVVHPVNYAVVHPSVVCL